MNRLGSSTDLKINSGIMDWDRKLCENLRPSGLRINHGEFDPGSERTLAARLKHASRTGSVACYRESGGLVSNT